MNWEDIKKAADVNIRPVTGGFTHAKRGIVTLADKSTVFVKIAVDEMTQGWLDKEIRAYMWLNEHGYSGAPKMLAHGNDGFALPDLSMSDWSPSWDHDKLQAMFKCIENLTPFSESAREYFNVDNLGPNTLAKHDYTQDNFGWIKMNHPGLYDEVRAFIADEKFFKKCRNLAATDPWRGTELVHFDARSDNFGYSPASKKGMLVDWNWSCIGSKGFEKTVMLVSVQKTGFDVFQDCPDELDAASLAWISGFWLMALYGKDDTSLHHLRTHQVESMLVAINMLRQLI